MEEVVQGLFGLGLEVREGGHGGRVAGGCCGGGRGGCVGRGSDGLFNLIKVVQTYL